MLRPFSACGVLATVYTDAALLLCPFETFFIKDLHRNLKLAILLHRNPGNDYFLSKQELYQVLPLEVHDGETLLFSLCSCLFFLSPMKKFQIYHWSDHYLLVFYHRLLSVPDSPLLH